MVCFHPALFLGRDQGIFSGKGISSHTNSQDGILFSLCRHFSDVCVLLSSVKNVLKSLVLAWVMFSIPSWSTKKHVHTLFFSLIPGFLHPVSWWRGIENRCAWRLIIISENRPVPHAAKWCMGEWTTPACVLGCMFYSVLLLSPAKTFVKTALRVRSCAKIQNKGIVSEAKRHMCAHAHTMFCV